MTYTRIKICGITSVEDARVAADAGADAIGMVFYDASPRAVSIERGSDIVASLGPLITTVALFVNPQPALVNTVIEQVRPRLLQFHGDEDQDFCGQFGLPFLKAIRVKPGEALVPLVQAFPHAVGLLFDAWNPKLYGGTGETFDWQSLKSLSGFPLILAGGLTPENVAEAITQVSPYAVDVSGGVEAEKGVKDADKLRRFIMAVRAVDQQNH